MYKKVSLCIVSTVLIFSLLFVMMIDAYATNNDLSSTGATSGTTGDCIWTIDGNKLIISGEGAMADYNSSGANTPWEANRKSITEVVIETGVSGVGNGAFAEMSALQTLRIQANVDYIGKYAFSRCTSLTEINECKGAKQIRNRAFEGCSALEEVFINSVEEIHADAFRDCTALSSFNTNSEIKLVAAGAFEGCKLLDKSSHYVRINSENNKNCMIYVSPGVNEMVSLSCNYVTIGEEAFKDAGCYKVRMFNTIKYINQKAFYNCTNLKSITIPGSVEEIGNKAFGYTNDGKISDFSIYAYEDSPGHKYAVENGFNYVKISPDDPFETGTTGECEWKVSYGGVLTISGNGEMGDYRFIDYGKEHPWSGDLLSYSHPNNLCSMINEIVIENGVTVIGTLAFPDFIYLQRVTIPSSVRKVGELAFDNCKILRTIEFPEGVESIGDSAFKRCYSLNSAYISSSVTFIHDSAFDDCAYLTIYGYSGTYAESYAEEHNIPFVSLEKEITYSWYADGGSNQIRVDEIKEFFVRGADESAALVDYYPNSVLSWESSNSDVISIDSYDEQFSRVKLKANTAGQSDISLFVDGKKVYSFTVYAQFVNAYYPIVIIPGIMGSRLFSSDKVFDDSTKVWDPNETYSGISQLSSSLNPDNELYTRPCENQNIDTTQLVSNSTVDNYGREYGARDNYKNIVERLCSAFPYSDISRYRPVYFFSYDWRKSNAESAKQLRKEIEKICDETSKSKVDILCHSMGGLVASKYYTEYASDDHINKIITCGTPYEGSPTLLNSVLNWDVLGKGANPLQINTYVDLALAVVGGMQKELKASFSGVVELAPTLNYVSKIKMQTDSNKSFGIGEYRISTDQYKDICREIFGESNYNSALRFQSSLNSDVTGYNNLLDYPESYFSIGINHKTISSIKFKYYFKSVDQMIIERLYESDIDYDVTGDGTVPYLSSSIIENVEELPSYRWRLFDADHGETINKEKCMQWIIEVLEDSEYRVTSDAIDKKRFIKVLAACPVDITVTKDEEVLSSLPDNTSFNADFGRLDLIGESGEIKALCIDYDTDYNIDLIGNGTGSMDYLICFYNESGELTEEHKFLNVDITENTIISTSTNNEETIVLEMDNDGDGTIDQIIEPDPPCLGDVDGDGNITVIDATGIQRVISGIDLLFNDFDSVADADRDGEVTVMDATYIQSWLAEIISDNKIGKQIA